LIYLKILWEESEERAESMMNVVAKQAIEDGGA
jgi:hypothetical protein